MERVKLTDHVGNNTLRSKTQIVDLDWEGMGLGRTSCGPAKHSTGALKQQYRAAAEREGAGDGFLKIWKEEAQNRECWKGCWEVKTSLPGKGPTVQASNINKKIPTK